KVHVIARSLFEVSPQKMTTKQSPDYEVLPAVAPFEIDTPEPSLHFVVWGLLHHVRDGVSKHSS
ncbi:MAG: hypothetical protein WKF87_11730, partial [Chryseolinea sp.]